MAGGLRRAAESARLASLAETAQRLAGVLGELQMESQPFAVQLAAAPAVWRIAHPSSLEHQPGLAGAGSATSGHERPGAAPMASVPGAGPAKSRRPPPWRMAEGVIGAEGGCGASA